MDLQVGNKAPNFKTKDHNGNVVSLADFVGKKLVLFFYPKDNTPGCILQVCNLRDNYKELQHQGYEILGISADSSQSHQKFIERRKLSFRLLVDDSHELCEKYGVSFSRSIFGLKFWGINRTTFVIDEKGFILKIINKIKVRDHAAQILA